MRIAAMPALATLAVLAIARTGTAPPLDAASPSDGGSTPATSLRLVSTAPLPDATVPPPAEIRLRLSEPILSGSSHLDLLDASATTIATAVGTPDPADPSVLVVSLASVLHVTRPDARMGARDPADPGTALTPSPALPDGRYEVRWVAVGAADGARASGSFDFTVASDAGIVPGPSATAAGAAGPILLAAIGILALLGLLVGVERGRPAPPGGG